MDDIEIDNIVKEIIRVVNTTNEPDRSSLVRKLVEKVEEQAFNMGYTSYIDN